MFVRKVTSIVLAIGLMMMFACNNLWADVLDYKGNVITEKEIKDEMGYGARIRWTLLFGCLGSGIGGVPGYFYGAHRDRKGAIRRINSYRLLQELESRNASEAEMQTAIDEAIDANMGVGWRWGFTSVGAGVGGVVGLFGGATIAYERGGDLEAQLDAGGIGMLIGATIGGVGGYYLGKSLDRRAAIRKGYVKLLQLGIQRHGAFLDEPKRITRHPTPHETYHILHLVSVRF